MFLDEELLQELRGYDGTEPDDINDLNTSLCKKCEAYYKSKMSITSTERQVKTALDRTFNLWDSFIRMALIDEDGAVVILAELFQKHTFKHQFLKNEQIAKVYNSLS